jgi:hypothetical protein
LIHRTKGLGKQLAELFSPLLPDLVLYTKFASIGSSKEPTKEKRSPSAKQV